MRKDDVKEWEVPYLLIDPTDIGRVYEADVIRINSQSGKGGIGYIMETQFNLNLPPKMREAFGYHIKSISDHEHRELQPIEVYNFFMRDFVNIASPIKVVSAVYGDHIDDTERNVTPRRKIAHSAEVCRSQLLVYIPVL